MKTIFVLTDFSDRAASAAEYALNVAIKSNANLLLLHAMELAAQITPGVEFTWPMADYNHVKNESVHELKALAHRLEVIAQENGNFVPAITYLTEFGFLDEVAQKTISEKNPDMVIIGAHKSSGISRLLFGSHTNTLLDKISCPVLLVPENLKFKGIKQISYATDLTFNNLKVVNYLADFAKPLDAGIAVNHIYSPAYPVTDAEQNIWFSLKEHMKLNHPRIAYRTITGENVKSTLQQITTSGLVDVLALVHKRYDFFDRIFHASISKQLAHTAIIPLLVLPYSFSMDVPDMTNEELDQLCFDNESSR
ncbi:MAG: universal stress protein UspE [Sphingobacteriaceae bacterium]|jgi:nucleotide-binding universal stress UspA family protein|nr:universal stress protein UspE [Sphingobacteriaceae bacterium]